MTIQATRPDRNADGAGSDFAGLRRLIEEAGLLRRRSGYYATRIGLVVAAFVLGWSAFVVVGDSWWQLVTAGFLAVVFMHAVGEPLRA